MGRSLTYLTRFPTMGYRACALLRSSIHHGIHLASSGNIHRSPLSPEKGEAVTIFRLWRGSPLAGI